MMDDTVCDIAVIGGGVVGLSLVAALADTGLNIVVLEAKPAQLDWSADSLDLRVFALTQASVTIFQHLNLWQTMQSNASPFKQMLVWDAKGKGEIAFDSMELAQTSLGYVVEQRVLLKTLWQAINLLPNVTIHSNVLVQGLELTEQQAKVVYGDEQQLTAKLVVAADGKDSNIRRLAAIKTTGWDYHQQALVANVKPELFHQQTAWQRFLPTGPLAFLPLNNGLCSIVWSVTEEKAEQLLSLATDEFAEQLTQAFAYKLGKVELISSVKSFPLRLQHSQQYIKPHLALIGDAAHSIHPLAGQGVNLGLLDAASLAEVISEALQKQRAIDSLATLRRYERWRKGDNLLMMGVMDGFKRLFQPSLFPVPLIRNLGLSLTNKAKPIKHKIMQRAMGLAGDLPKLAQPILLNERL